MGNCPTLLLTWISREDIMKRQWQIRRELLAIADGQRRRDQAYQQLLSWTSPASPTQWSVMRSEQEAEVQDARSDLCAGIDAAADADADD